MAIKGKNIFLFSLGGKKKRDDLPEILFTMGQN